MTERAAGRQAWRLAALTAVVLTTACVGRRAPVRPAEPDPAATPGARVPNRVAVLVPLTGPDAGVGTSIANAANLALLDSGGAGVRLTVYDTGAGAAAAAQTALADGNGLFLGPLLAGDLGAVAPLARRAGVPVIAFSNDDGVAGGGTYILGFTPEQSIGRAVRFARGAGATGFAALVPEGLYGARARTALTRSVSDAGGRVVAVQGYARSTAAIAAAARTAAARPGTDAVVIADASGPAATAAPLLKGAGRPRQIIGTELWSTDRLIGSKAALRGAIFAGVSDERFNQFVTRYRARYGKIPYRLGSLGYDGVLLAVRIARDWRPGGRFPDRLLLQPDGFSGVDGAFRFRRDGTAERQLAVHRVTAAGATVISPAPTGFGP